MFTIQFIYLFYNSINNNNSYAHQFKLVIPSQNMKLLIPECLYENKIIKKMKKKSASEATAVTLHLII